MLDMNARSDRPMIVRPDAQPETVDREHQRFLECDQPVDQPGEAVPPGNEGRVGRALRHLEQVGAGAEGPAFAGEHDDRDRPGRRARPASASVSASYNASLNGVERLGTIEREHADAIGVFTSQHSFSVAVSGANRQNRAQRAVRTERSEPSEPSAANRQNRAQRTVRTERSEPSEPSAANRQNRAQRTVRTERSEPSEPSAANRQNRAKRTVRTERSEPSEPSAANRQNEGRSSMPERPSSALTASTWCIWVLPSSKLSADAAM